MIFKVLCDVHISFKIVRYFESKGYEAVHVNSILLGDRSTDSSIADYANVNQYVVISKDVDFKNSHLLRGSPKKLLKIDLGNLSTTLTIELLDRNLPKIIEAFEAESCLVEIGSTYLRIYQ